MDAIFRTFVIYIFLMVVFRMAGRRTVDQMTGFDFVLLLIIGEATQQALLGDDFSITNALLVITTLIGIDIAFSLVKRRFPALEKWIDGVPTIVVQNGQPVRESMDKSRIEEDDVLASARELQGLEQMEQIKYAVLERNGKISIIPVSKQ